jgi:hypothetical protein
MFDYNLVQNHLIYGFGGSSFHSLNLIFQMQIYDLSNCLPYAPQPLRVKDLYAHRHGTFGKLRINSFS